MDSDVHRPRGDRVDQLWTEWRRRVLFQAGFGDALARRLASDPALDLHDLLELVDRGCPPEVAARILAPL
jgi:hypothetical protein